MFEYLWQIICVLHYMLARSNTVKINDLGLIYYSGKAVLIRLPECDQNWNVAKKKKNKQQKNNTLFFAHYYDNSRSVVRGCSHWNLSYCEGKFTVFLSASHRKSLTENKQQRLTQRNTHWETGQYCRQPLPYVMVIPGPLPRYPCQPL